MSTHNIPFSILKRKFNKNFATLLLWGVFLRTQERVRNSRGKRAISVRATEVLLYLKIKKLNVFLRQKISHTSLHKLVEVMQET